ncbi:hypothetical protein JCM19233_2498 [Vibrio astriarenae]|nr:hypothetical protein JCM19233_2498 [Vibrio sp. C7]
MTSKIPFYISVVALVVAGIMLSVFRHQTYGVPWTPGETRQVWDIEARLEFSGQGEPIKASLAAPHTQPATHSSVSLPLLKATVLPTLKRKLVVALNGRFARPTARKPFITEPNSLLIQTLTLKSSLLKVSETSQPLAALSKLLLSH